MSQTRMSAPKFMAIHPRVVETFQLKLAQPHGGARGTADDRQSHNACYCSYSQDLFYTFPFIVRASSRAVHSGCIFKTSQTTQASQILTSNMKIQWNATQSFYYSQSSSPLASRTWSTLRTKLDVSTVKFSKIQALLSHQLKIKIKHTLVEQGRTEGEKGQTTWNTYSHDSELGTFLNSGYKKKEKGRALISQTAFQLLNPKLTHPPWLQSETVVRCHTSIAILLLL